MLALFEIPRLCLRYRPGGGVALSGLLAAGGDPVPGMAGDR